MRFVLYNIAYGTGGPRSSAHSLLSMHRYLRGTERHFKKLCDFFMDLKPDLIGLVEVDDGSLRTNRSSQVLQLSRILEHNIHYAGKYGKKSMMRFMPVTRRQGNAVLMREKPGNRHIHFFKHGMKRLILEVEMETFRLFLVHLSLRKRVRAKQLKFLEKIIASTPGPVILAGDFNTFRGAEEIHELITTSNLKSANLQAEATYPSWAPRHQLDFIFCSQQIQIERCDVLDGVGLSDHLPLLMDFSVH